MKPTDADARSAGPTSGAAGRRVPRESALDRRRRKWWRARRRADDAVGVVRQLEEQIDTNTERARTQHADLRAALDQVAALKKAIKASAKGADRLRAARAVARRRVAKAQQRAADAERRYDDALLPDLLRREKENDLAAHPPSRRSTEPGDRKGALDVEESDDDTARTTAARQTARRAGTGTGRRSRPR